MKEGKISKKSNVIITLILILLILISCIAIWYFVTEENKKPKVDEQDIEVISNETLFNSETLPRVDTALATQPLMDEFILDFTKATTKDLGIKYTNTQSGYIKLINNETDLIIATDPSEEELKLAKEKNIELEVTPVAKEGLTFFVNKNNKVDTISLEQIRKIYNGNITNWKEVGGEDAPIIAYQTPTNSENQIALLNLVMKGQKIKELTEKETAELSIAEIVDNVANYDNGKNIIGFGFHYYANVMYKNDNLKFIKVNGIEPTEESIKKGIYPIRTAYNIVTRKGENNNYVAKLKGAMLSSRGQKLVNGAGYISVK